MAERLTTLAKRLRPFIAGMVGNMASGGAFVTEGPGIDIVGQTVGLGGDTVLLYDSSGNPVAEWAATGAGLIAAAAAATTGDVVFIDKVCTITGDVTIGAGIMLIGRSRMENIIIGKITLGDGASVYNLTVANAANDANPLYGVVGPVTGTAYIYGCDISAIQSGAGDAFAIGAINGLIAGNGDIVVRYSNLYGSSVSGGGYAIASTYGEVYARWCELYGSTDRIYLRPS